MKNILFIFVTFLLFGLTSCKKDEDYSKAITGTYNGTINYSVPVIGNIELAKDVELEVKRLMFNQVNVGFTENIVITLPPPYDNKIVIPGKIPCLCKVTYKDSKYHITGNTTVNIPAMEDIPDILTGDVSVEVSGDISKDKKANINMKIQQITVVYIGELK